MNKKEGINGKALVSIVLGVLAYVTPLIGFVLGIIGLYLSIVAIKEIIATKVSGFGIATMGLIICIAGIVHQSLSVLKLIS